MMRVLKITPSKTGLSLYLRLVKAQAKTRVLVRLEFRKNQSTWFFNWCKLKSPKAGDRKFGKYYYMFTFKISELICSVIIG